MSPETEKEEMSAIQQTAAQDANNPDAPGPSLQSDRALPARENQLLELLPRQESAVLAAHSKVVQLKKGQLLMQAGETIDYVYFPLSGMVSLIAALPDGKLVEVASIGRDGALNDAFVAQIAQTVACTAFHDAEARLSRYLLKARDCVGSATLPMTQEMISEALGVRRTTVTFIAGTLQSRGIISYQRGTLEITDEVALSKLACPCYQSMRCVTDDLFSAMRPEPLRSAPG